ncbi:MAG: hypothetical protein ACP5KJ_04090 [Candidatus Micrarchaeia archaeon]
MVMMQMELIRIWEKVFAAVRNIDIILDGRENQVLILEKIDPALQALKRQGEA